MSVSLRFALILSILQILPTPSSAWQQSVRPDSDGVMIPIRWESPGFMYSIHADGSAALDFDSVERAVDAAFSVWGSVSCSGFQFEKTEAARVSEIGVNSDRGNVNLVVFREDETDWPWEAAAVAMTSVSYDSSGRIIDVDIELNGAWWTFDILAGDVVSATSFDLQGVLVHEIGHALGLDHSLDEEASMFAAVEPGQTGKRDLAADDIEGLCALYPADVRADDIDPPLCGLDLDGLSSECADDSGGSSPGCHFAARDASDNASRWTLLRLLLLF